MTVGYEILEHTADIGIRSWGRSLEECFEQAAWGLAEILGARGEERRGKLFHVFAGGEDRGAQLVDLLNEILLLHETHEVAFVGIRVVEVSGSEVEAQLEVVPLRGETETTGVKAATFHRLDVRDVPEGVEARVYLDV